MPIKPKLPRLLMKIAEAQKHHRERHRPTGFQFAISDSIGLLDGAAWDAVTGGASFFIRRPYLEALEKHRPENMRSRYALIARDGEPAAAVAAQRVDLPTAGKLLKTRLLICGNTLSWGRHGAAWRAGVAPEEIWPAVTEALYRMRRADRLAGQTGFIMIKDIDAVNADGARSLAHFSYRAVETEPNMVLAVPSAWRNYEDYLQSLEAKYRKSAKQTAKAVADAGCTVERLADLEPEAARLHELYLMVQANQRIRPVTAPASYLPAVARAAGGGFRCTAIRRSGELLGFVTSIKDGDCSVGYMIGFDRAASAEVPLYLRLLQAVVADAIDMRCSSLSLGRTALEPKARLGARPVPMSVWVRHRHPTLNLVVRRVLGAVSHDDAPERNPFKAAQGAP